jgi:hypothetical protein
MVAAGEGAGKIVKPPKLAVTHERKEVLFGQTKWLWRNGILDLGRSGMPPNKNSGGRLETLLLPFSICRFSRTDWFRLGY